MQSDATVYRRFFVMFAVLGVLGVGGFGYTLVQQRFRVPLKDTYTIKAQFTAGNGVVSGIGQSVDVVGVGVGQITGVELEDGVAVVSMRVEAEKLPYVYANATASLRPITPLGDLRIDLEPGAPPARPLAENDVIRLATTTAAVPLGNLLSRLDTDTRDYVTGLIAGLDQGTRDRGPDMRRLLRTLGPTTRQVATISRALGRRSTALSGFVHNLASVTDAASQDGQLVSVVRAGNQTLGALARQDEPLRAAITKLPGTLQAVRTTLTDIQPFADLLGPTLTELQPAVRRLPQTLKALGDFTSAGAPVLRADVNPLVERAAPLLRDARPAVADLDRSTPLITGAAQSLNYLLNELAYVPSKSNPGFLFWGAWALHNLNSAFGQADANGTILRAMIIQNCAVLTAQPDLQKVFDAVGVCPA